MIDVTILLLEDTFASTAVGPMEVFRHAGVIWNMMVGESPVPRFKVRAASLTGRAITSDGGLVIRPACSIASIRATDLIFIPSTGLGFDTAVQRNAPLIPWLRRMRKRGCGIAAVCSGVALLAASGLLDGRRATTHWGLAERFRRQYPRVQWAPELLVTDSDGLYCGGGVNASLDLSLHLVERHCGHDVAVQCARALLIETPRTWQAGFALVPVRAQCQDSQVARAQDWIQEHFRGEVSIAGLASHAGMSPRNLARRFKAATGDTPLEYLQKVRIAAARRLLERADRTVQEISEAVGYEDAAHFRGLFRRHTGASPLAYRRRFGPSRRAAGPRGERIA